MTLLVDETGEQISCLLNPESLTRRRRAGVRERARLGDALAGAGGDDPLLFTGGGASELEVDLLFDTDVDAPPTVAGAAGEPHVDRDGGDVRRRTGRIWRLGENAAAADQAPRPPRLRLIWGKSWNLPCVVLRLAERLERFDASGAPRRSWLRLHLRQLEIADAAEPDPAALPPAVPPAPLARGAAGGAGAADDAATRTTGARERLDLVASERFGAPGYWRWIALVNDLDDPLRVAAGTTLQLPPPPTASAVGSR